MKKIQHIASALVLAAATAVGTAHATGNDVYYPENPNPGHNSGNNNGHNNNGNNQGSVHHNNNTTNNTHNTTNNTTNNATTYANQQQQMQNQTATANATGGAGGQGGMGGAGGNGGNGYGGAGGNGYGGNATGGNATGGNATGGEARANATGGEAQSSANATGGQSNATGGQSNASGGASNSGGNSMSMSSKYEAAKPMGNVGSVAIVPAANCGTGWALNVSVPFFGAGGGRTGIDQQCLSMQAAQTAINAGLVARDSGMVATGLAGLRNLHIEFDAAATTVIANLKKPCAAEMAKVSAMMLTDPDMQCDEILGFVKELEKAETAPVRAEQQVVNVRVVNDAPLDVSVDGVVKTKEQYTPRKGPAPKKEPLQVEVVKMPCTTACPSLDK